MSPTSSPLTPNADPRIFSQTIANSQQTPGKPALTTSASPFPIPIPTRKKVKSPPITPLTARGSPPTFRFGHQRGREMMSPRPGSPLLDYTPTSPLSPTLPPQSSFSVSRQKDRHPPRRLSLAGLPKFHPAKFTSDRSRAPTSSPTSTRFGLSQSRVGRGETDARQRLHQYQREVIASATQASRSPTADSPIIKPGIPRLTPLESPVDQMTPLVLEGQDDYLRAGSRSSPTGFADGDRGDMVERLVRLGNERRDHPAVRSPSISPAVSPAISPAGGHG